jgi:hypothetical protein
MTSLASLAANPTSHPTTSGLIMSTSGNGGVTASSSASAASVDLLNDTNYEIKSEFYTREGIWKAAPGGEYARQTPATTATANLNYSQSANTGLGNANSSAQSLSYAASPIGMGIGMSGTTSTGIANATGGGLAAAANNNNTTTTNNDPVRIASFKFSKSILNNASNTDNTGLPVPRVFSRACNSCMRKRSAAAERRRPTRDLNDLLDEEDVYCDEEEDDDDDDDVICAKLRDDLTLNTSFNSASVASLGHHQYFCKYCKMSMNGDGELSANEPPSPTLDMLLFNYSREIYFYEFNPIKATVSYKKKRIILSLPGICNQIYVITDFRMVMVPQR